MTDLPQHLGFLYVLAWVLSAGVLTGLYLFITWRFFMLLSSIYNNLAAIFDKPKKR